MRKGLTTMARGALAVSVAALLTASAAQADTIVLRNGDRLSGKVVSAEAGKVTFTPAFNKATPFSPAANVTLDQADIASIVSDVPMELKLKDGSFSRQAQAGGRGTPLAQIAKINPTTGWTGAFALNGMYYNGNTTNAAVGISAEATRRTDLDRVILNGGYNYAVTRNTGGWSTNAANWWGEAAYNYFFSSPWYAYGDVRLSGDRVVHLNLRAAPSAGIGYQFVDRPDFHANIEAGPAFLHEEYSTQTQNSFAGRIGWHIDKSFYDDRFMLFHNLSLLKALNPGNSYVVTGDVGARAAVMSRMFVEVKYSMTYDSTPAPGNHRTTSRIMAGAGYSF